MTATRQPIYRGDGTALIPLTRGLFATVDAEDAEWLSQWNWCAQFAGKPANPFYYAARRETIDGRSRIRLMHKALCPALKDVDHININKLDNRKANLRPATRSQNMGNSGLRSDNTTGYKGVRYVPRGRKPWQAWVARKYAGSYATLEDAALAYNKLAIEHYGADYAYLNVIPVAEAA